MATSVTARRGGYVLSDDKARIDPDVVWHFLSTQAYWGRWRDRADVEAQLADAWRVVGAYAESGQMVGYARSMSDGLNSAYLADVFVLDEHRGHGLGKALVAELVTEGPGATMHWMLHTADAHGLYRGLGFAPGDLTYLERPRPVRDVDGWERDVAEVWSADLEGDAVVERIEALAAQRPASAEAEFELASAYDYAGREADAEPRYRRALELGLDGERRPRAVIQLASTVRNLGRPDDALDLLREPLPIRFADARAAFTALALIDAGREREAALTALDALVDRLPVYGRAAGSYVEELRQSSES